MVGAGVVTGIGIEMGGGITPPELLSGGPVSVPGQFDPLQKLGGKGLRYKDRATLLSLCAVQAALQDAYLTQADLSQTAVVVSSNLGNVASVCRAVTTIHAGSVEQLSPMGLPNVSSNNIASTLGIRWGCQGPNLTVCNGATSGVDALYLAGVMVRIGRAPRVIVVGVEPHDEVTRALLAPSTMEKTMLHADIPPGEGAACLIIEAEAVAAQRGATPYARLGRYHCATPPNPFATSAVGAHLHLDAGVHLWLTPDQRWQAISAMTHQVRTSLGRAAPTILDVEARFGELYGALGVFQAVAACAWLVQATADAAAVLMAGGTRNDGLAMLRMERAGSHQVPDTRL